MPRDNSIKSVLIIGSGPIIIGQACEFDYSGSQAARSLKEEGVKVTLINSNPATIMTDKVTAENIYLLPLEVKSIIKILEENKDIDAVLPSVGGQTAGRLGVRLTCQRKNGAAERAKGCIIPRNSLTFKGGQRGRHGETASLRDLRAKPRR